MKYFLIQILFALQWNTCCNKKLQTRTFSSAARRRNWTTSFVHVYAVLVNYFTFKTETETFLQKVDSIIICTIIVLPFGRVRIYSRKFVFIHQTSKNRVWGICFCICTCIFVIICIRICEPPVAWDFWEQGWRWDGGGRVIARPPKQLTTMTSSIGKAALQPLYFKPCICCGSTLYLTYIHTSVHLILLYCFTLYEFSTFF